MVKIISIVIEDVSLTQIRKYQKSVCVIITNKWNANAHGLPRCLGVA